MDSFVSCSALRLCAARHPDRLLRWAKAKGFDCGVWTEKIAPTHPHPNCSLWRSLAHEVQRRLSLEILHTGARATTLQVGVHGFQSG